MRSLTGEEAATAAGLRAAAEATLRAWPEARAVLLYGSRAAGEPRPGKRLGHRAGHPHGARPAAERLPICDLPGRIAPAALPEAWLRAEANTRGALACDIARHGVLLAGEWTPPPLEDAPRMSAHHYGRGTVQAAGELDTGLTALARIDGRSLMADECACERFERGTSDMARLLARAVLHRRGVDFQPTPDLSVLGQAAAEAGQVALGETLKAMNGGPKRPRNAPWWEDGCRMSGRRPAGSGWRCGSGRRNWRMRSGTTTRSWPRWRACARPRSRGVWRSWPQSCAPRRSRARGCASPTLSRRR